MLQRTDKVEAYAQMKETVLVSVISSGLGVYALNLLKFYRKLVSEE